MRKGLRYLVRIENSGHLDVSQYRPLRQRLVAALGSAGCRVNSSRITGIAVEVDFFAPDTESAERGRRILSGIGKVLSYDILSVEKRDERTAAQVMEEARRLFNEERFWEVHEMVEGLWRKAAGRERQILQGIILYAAAYVHYQKNEMQTAIGMLGRALSLLNGEEKMYECFDLGLMRKKAVKMIDTGIVEVFRL
ncbi:MAG: DUF309 domain-containing protein [Candidatus Thermoplasmatota archaeon]|uniref:DUF309 domain-containing protein n=1 Tax=Candidatus Sysuiplasma superficiale TaxID=2823368 RepID=A0A8J7YRD4_9ARCH|nr:DUF309 domain-containing protein [Candidatus Sysuiplasma superficiale]MCL4347202.1 DUF309 domain-containing protein [Candidatus Thermoplasmatota archaeon]